jgi:bisphosphoglycerate-dependent phosphoglycerate mutase
MMSYMSERVKVSMNLAPEDIQDLRVLAERRGISMTEVVRRALALEKFVENATDSGEKVLIEAHDKTLKQLVLI